jgi:glycosyltransferase involved in cell wall biosynthesis
MTTTKVGVLPYHYAVDTNPYQKLVCDALENQGCHVSRISQQRWFPTKKINQLELDVVHMDWLTGYYFGKRKLVGVAKRILLMRALKQVVSAKKVWTVHNVFQHEKGKNDLERKIIRKIIDSCDGLVFHTNVAKQVFSNEFDLSAIDTAIIPHGHYIDAYDNQVSRSAARQELGIDDDANVVLFFGRLRKYKGIEDLVRAFPKAGANPNDVLIVAGLPFPDYPIDEVRALAKKMGIQRFIFEPRHVQDKELQTLFNACDVVVLPFKNILNSGSLILAMSFGCSVVAPRIGAVPEVAFEQGYWGYSPADSNGLTDGIKNALNEDRPSREEVISYCRKTLSWQDIGFKLNSFYNKLLAKP